MIHRFVDLLEVVDIPWTTIWNVQRQTGGTNRFFALDTKGVSDLAVYLSVSQSTVGAPSNNRPELSPDLMEFAYVLQSATGSRTDVMIGDPADVFAEFSIAQNPSGGVADPPLGGTEIIGWSPDSAQVYYRGINNNTDRDGEIWRVDRDGTNGTLIYSNAAFDGVAWGQLPRISPDGTMIAFWIDVDAPTQRGLWVMDSDGTGATRLYTEIGTGEFFGWSRDSEWLLFRDDSSAGNWHRVMKIQPDGSGQTTIYETTRLGVDRPVLGLGTRSVWLPDTSGVFCAINDGTDTEVGVLAVDGSETFTPFSPQRVTLVGPIQSAGRCWWVEGSLATDAAKVVSALPDGSDYRVDDDMTSDVGTPDHDDFVFRGFHVRLA